MFRAQVSDGVLIIAGSPIPQWHGYRLPTKENRYLMILSSRRYSLSYASPLRDNSTRSPNCAMALLPQRKITPYLMTTKENHFILDNRKETSHRI